MAKRELHDNEGGEKEVRSLDEAIKFGVPATANGR